MPDDHRREDERLPEGWPFEKTGDVPASVTFMEMMRRAAAQSPKSDAAEQLFSRSVRRRPAPEAPAENPAPPPVAIYAGADTQREAAMEEERIKRIKRRRVKRRQRTVGALGAVIRSFLVVGVAALLMATIFTWWTPSQFLTEDVKRELSVAQAASEATVVPTPIPTPNWLKVIGIVSGHRGRNPKNPLPDPGAVCPDGLTEAEINFAVAQLVVRSLRARGYSVDLLDEFDPRLENYQAAALVSIHANTCQSFGETVSGYLIARAAARTLSGPDDLLVDCISGYYAQWTGLPLFSGPPTVDMTDYHSFREIHPLTPAAIIELGFMLADRAVLTGKQAEMAQGIADGILCFLEPGSAPPTVIPASEQRS